MSVQVVAVRLSRLRGPVDVPEERRYAGCVSWVELSADVPVTGALPVVQEPEFGRRLAALADALGAPDE